MKKPLSLYARMFETPRCEGNYQPVTERLRHFNEFRIPLAMPAVSEQGGRCMTCGIPFCHNAGCPLGNPIPEANALVREDRWKDAIEIFHAYNNFPEFTGRLCPAPCEASCVHYINGEPVTIRQIELEIVERAWREGWIKPLPPKKKTGKRVAVIGSGPAGLAAAQQLARAGHDTVLYERDNLPGGILRYGIPDFKLEKSVLDRRLEQLKAEGVRFETNVAVGEDISPLYLKRQFDAVILTGGAMEPRDLPVPGRDAQGIHFAMEYLIASNHAVHEDRRSAIDADGQKVIILGGGDTGADCLGVALRQGATSVTQLEIMPKPPEEKNELTPWPRWPQILRTGTSHKEGGTRCWNVSTKQFLTDHGCVAGLEGMEVDWASGKPVEKAGSEFKLQADIVLLALGFVHPKQDALLEMLGVVLDSRKNVKTAPETMMTNVPGIFAAGDMQSGASLVVRCIAGGRQAANNADRYLMGTN